MSGIRVRAMTPGDVAAVVSIHLEAFSGFFLTFLGPRFLAVLYRGIVDDVSSVAFVAESGGTVAGFVAGTTVPSQMYARLLKRRALSFAFAALPAVLRRPAIVPRLVRALARPAQAPPPASGVAELMSLAVRPSAQRRGVGEKLTEVFMAEACGRGAAAVCLTTDADGNEHVNRFYARAGFTLLRTFTTPEGKRRHEFERRCAHASGPVRDHR